RVRTSSKNKRGLNPMGTRLARAPFVALAAVLPLPFTSGCTSPDAAAAAAKARDRSVSGGAERAAPNGAAVEPGTARTSQGVRAEHAVRTAARRPARAQHERRCEDHVSAGHSPC